VDTCATTPTKTKTPKAVNRTEKHWLTSPETCVLDYEVPADWLINSAFNPSRLMPGKSVVTTLTQKQAVFPTFSSRKDTFSQLCPTRSPWAVFCPVEGFVRPGLAFCCSWSILCIDNLFLFWQSWVWHFLMQVAFSATLSYL